jgi:apolipoprotein N-acyltransferase
MSLSDSGPTVEATGIGRLALRVRSWTRLRAIVAAFGAGAFATLALPPVHALPILWASVPLLLWLLDAAPSGRAAFWRGWAFGFGFFLFGLYWIAFALAVDWARFWWMTPFVAAGLPAFLAVFTGIVGWAYRRLRFTGVARVLGFAVLWSLIAEWLRGWVLTGFPWNLLGYGWTGFLPVLQGVSQFGIYALSFMTVLAAAAPAALDAPPGERRASVGLFAALLALFTALGFWGANRMANSPTAHADAPVIRIVQPNIDQREKMQPGAARVNFQRLLLLARSPSDVGLQPNVIVLPETAVPFLLEEDEVAASILGGIAPPSGFVITGALRRSQEPGTTAGDWRYWNSLQAIDASGRVHATFDKFHLVPFGEYTPLRGILPVEPIAVGAMDFSRGPGPRSLRLPGLPAFGATICYEAIFPGAVTDPNDRPSWIVNVTNDGWYGNTAGPHQHFAMAQTRAVEEGLPLVRAANTGISGVIDAAGRIVAERGLGEEGVVDAVLPPPFEQKTNYQRFGELVFFGMIGMITAVLTMMKLRRKF